MVVLLLLFVICGFHLAGAHTDDALASDFADVLGLAVLGLLLILLSWLTESTWLGHERTSPPVEVFLARWSRAPSSVLEVRLRR